MRPPFDPRLAVPTLVTLANVACGFLAIVLLATMGLDPTTGAIARPLHVVVAGWLVVAAWLLDMVDGQVAKLLKVPSAFGAQLDSLCDAVSFGAAPALLIATTSGPGFGHPCLWPAIAGLVFLLAVIVRLARFNTTDDDEGHMYFAGLPSPAGGMAIASTVLSARWLAEAPSSLLPIRADVAQAIAGAIPALLPVLALLLATLMVSHIRYADLPKHYLKKVAPRAQLLVLPVLAVFTSAQVMLAVYFGMYALLGACGLWRRPRLG